MKYLYHFRAPNFSGDKLYPLNTLKDIYPQIYEQQLSKYQGREALLTEIIPKLNCLWNDVVHCVPIHPYYIYETLQNCGLQVNWHRRCFQIPVIRLAGMPTVWYIHRPNKANPDQEAVEVEWFNPELYQELTEISLATTEYYRDTIAKGQRPLLHAGVPHVLVQGVLDVSNVKIITAGEKPS
jgi:hypothetical protein